MDNNDWVEFEELWSDTMFEKAEGFMQKIHEASKSSLQQN